MCDEQWRNLSVGWRRGIGLLIAVYFLIKIKSNGSQQAFMTKINHFFHWTITGRIFRFLIQQKSSACHTHYMVASTFVGWVLAISLRNQGRCCKKLLWQTIYANIGDLPVIIVGKNAYKLWQYCIFSYSLNSINFLSL